MPHIGMVTTVRRQLDSRSSKYRKVSKMKMPGFNAEMSIDQTRKSFGTIAEQTPKDRGHAVTPQFQFQFQGAVRHRFCHLVCFNGHCWCDYWF